MRKCYIHIGMPKTGSSSIQKTWFQNKTRIAEKFGIHYYSPYLNHGRLRPIFFKNPELFGEYYLANLTQKDSVQESTRLRKHLEKELRISGQKPFVLSAEGFSSLTRDQVFRLKQTLSPYFESISVIIYVREPFSYASSIAQQYVKSGATFSDILHDTFDVEKSEQEKQILSFSILPHYKFRIKKFQTIFGADNVIIKSFNPSKFTNNDIVHDFAETLFPDLNIMESISSAKTNESLNHEAVLLLEAVNRAYPLIERRSNIKRASNLGGILKTVSDGQKFEFSELNLKRFVDLIESDVKWLELATKGAISFDLTKPPIFRQNIVEATQHQRKQELLPHETPLIKKQHSLNPVKSLMKTLKKGKSHQAKNPATLTEPHALQQNSTDTTLLEMSAEICNHLALKNYNTNFLKNFFIIMNTYRHDNKYDGEGITRILKKCDREEDLVRMSNVLSQYGHHGQALQFAEKVIRLFPNNELMQSKVVRLKKMGLSTEIGTASLH